MKNIWIIFYSLNVRLFFKVANDQLIITCLINLDMIYIYIYIQSFKLVLNEIKPIEHKNSFIIILIRTDVFLKGRSNEEMARRDLQLHPRDTDLENTSLLILKYN